MVVVDEERAARRNPEVERITAVAFEVGYDLQRREEAGEGFLLPHNQLLARTLQTAADPGLPGAVQLVEDSIPAVEHVDRCSHLKDAAAESFEVTAGGDAVEVILQAPQGGARSAQDARNELGRHLHPDRNL